MKPAAGALAGAPPERGSNKTAKKKRKTTGITPPLKGVHRRTRPSTAPVSAILFSLHVDVRMCVQLSLPPRLSRALPMLTVCTRDPGDDVSIPGGETRTKTHKNGSRTMERPRGRVNQRTPRWMNGSSRRRRDTSVIAGRRAHRRQPAREGSSCQSASSPPCRNALEIPGPRRRAHARAFI